MRRNRGRKWGRAKTLERGSRNEKIVRSPLEKRPQMKLTVGGRSLIVSFMLDAGGVVIPKTVRIKTAGGLIKPAKWGIALREILPHLQKRL